MEKTNSADFCKWIEMGCKFGKSCEFLMSFLLMSLLVPVSLWWRADAGSLIRFRLLWRFETKGLHFVFPAPIEFLRIQSRLFHLMPIRTQSDGSRLGGIHSRPGSNCTGCLMKTWAIREPRGYNRNKFAPHWFFLMFHPPLVVRDLEEIVGLILISHNNIHYQDKYQLLSQA